MKTYVTFGQSHAHAINGKTFDRDCVAVIYAENAAKGRELAHEYFGLVFCTTYTDQDFDPDSMKYYPRGFINVNQPIGE